MGYWREQGGEVACSIELGRAWFSTKFTVKLVLMCTVKNPLKKALVAYLKNMLV